MAESDLDLARFGTVFKAFMEAAVDAAEPPSSPLLDRIAAHLGADPSQLPVISEEYDSFDQPNFQVAMDEYIQASGRLAQRLLGFHRRHEDTQAPPEPTPTGFPVSGTWGSFTARRRPH